jgi:hypothetical protein
MNVYTREVIVDLFETLYDRFWIVLNNIIT